LSSCLSTHEDFLSNEEYFVIFIVFFVIKCYLVADSGQAIKFFGLIGAKDRLIFHLLLLFTFLIFIWYPLFGWIAVLDRYFYF